jgi:hypothetical protein
MSEGGCRCGAVRYTLAIEAMPAVYCCHCRDCQSSSGSAFSQQAIVHSDAIAATGLLVTYDVHNPSGSISHQHSCGSCHTRIWNTNSARPGIAAVRGGTFDQSDALVPSVHIWVKRKQPWIVIADGVPVFDEAGDPAVMMTLFAR